jgi:hypothetical protein
MQCYNPFQLARGVKLPKPSVMTPLGRQRRGSSLRCYTASACMYRAALGGGSCALVSLNGFLAIPAPFALSKLRNIDQYFKFPEILHRSHRVPEVLRGEVRNIEKLC